MIRADDYLEYHAKLMSGIFDEELFKEMRADVLAKCDKIVENTVLYFNPGDGRVCPWCGAEMDFCDDEDEDYTFGYDLCYWKCVSCKRETSYNDFVEHIYGEVTDEHATLAKYADKLRNGAIDIQMAYFEIILQFVHGRGSMADWFIYGGDETLNMVREQNLEPYFQEEQ